MISSEQILLIMRADNSDIGHLFLIIDARHSSMHKFV